jgi:hypothetical protein
VLNPRPQPSHLHRSLTPKPAKQPNSQKLTIPHYQPNRTHLNQPIIPTSPNQPFKSTYHSPINSTQAVAPALPARVDAVTDLLCPLPLHPQAAQPVPKMPMPSLQLMSKAAAAKQKKKKEKKMQRRNCN